MQIEVLGERYQLQEPIGRGGMATIYRGRDMRMERVVAIKVLREVYSTDPKFVTRFQREAKAASVLQHPNIVQVFDYGQTDGNYFIVMELIEGTDLRRYLRSRGMLAVDRAVIIAHDVALGLGAAHRRNIVHRDVKPQNVLVGRDGSIKLTDFGIASVYKDINAERLTTTGMTLGTVQYYAPEQAQGEIVTPAADVYALGIVMYEMLTGRTPFDGDTPVAVAMQHIQDLPIPPSQFNPNIPQALEDIIMRCLEKIPEMRYRDGSVLARALENSTETDMEDFPTSLTPGMPQTPSGLPTYVQPMNNVIPGRPQRSSVSSPNNMAGVSPHDQASQFGQVGRSSPNNGAYNPEPLMLPNPAVYDKPIESSTTRPYERGTTPRSGAVERRDSRFDGIITAIILCITLLFLGFSLFLAADLGYIHIPGLNIGNPTPTPAVPGVKVPDLTGLSYAQALSTATSQGFILQTEGSTAGVVTKQNPAAGNNAASGTTIVVSFGPAPPKTVIVPNGLLGISVTRAEAILTGAHIPYTTVDTQVTDPTKPKNYVEQVSPASGQSIPVNTPVQLSIGNDTNVTPTVTPGITPTPSPTPKPSPSPTPSPTPKPSPSPTPSPTPTISPTATKSPKGG